MGNMIKIASSIEEIPKEDWNSLAVQTAPALDWEYFYALEKSGSISRDRGYKPSHIALYDGDKPLAMVPLYERDRAWVEFGDGGLIEFLTEMTGLPFHAGLLGSIPYTPVPGYDFLHSPEVDVPAVYRQIPARMDEICMERGLSTSRIYFVAPESRLHASLIENGYMEMSSSYLMWFNKGYSSYDDYLATFKSSRRTKLKRERREIKARGISLEMVRGVDAPDAFYQDIHLLYRHTWLKHMGPAIRPFLNESFFNLLGRHYRHRTSFSVATLNGKRAAMALFYTKSDALYGRYWGCFREIPFLHFATCYYYPIEYAIANRIARVDPGFGGEHKYIRGFETVSVSHYIKFYQEKQRRIAQTVMEQLREQLLLK
jgi:predicted N-acyltransferase